MAAKRWIQPWQWATRRWSQATHSLRGAMRGPLDLLFPPICAFCQRSLMDDDSQSGESRWDEFRLALCEHCRTRFERFPGATCRLCASPVGPGQSAKLTTACPPGDDRHRDEIGCAFCRTRKYAFQSATAHGPYRGPLREAVILAKRPSHEALAAALGLLLVAACRERWPDESPDLVVPIPMHWQRRFVRGANGVERIAESLALGLNCPCRLDLLAYARATAKQGLLSPTERFANVRGALRSTLASRRRAGLAGKRVLLVDDVMTTGATASEAAKALRRAGAAQVRVAVVARGTGHS